MKNHLSKEGEQDSSNQDEEDSHVPVGANGQEVDDLRDSAETRDHKACPKEGTTEICNDILSEKVVTQILE